MIAAPVLVNNSGADVPKPIKVAPITAQDANKLIISLFKRLSD